MIHQNWKKCFIFRERFLHTFSIDIVFTRFFSQICIIFHGFSQFSNKSSLRSQFHTESATVSKLVKRQKECHPTQWSYSICEWGANMPMGNAGEQEKGERNEGGQRGEDDPFRALASQQGALEN